MFSLESPHRGDSNEYRYTQYTIFNKKVESHSKLSQICNYEFFFKGLENKFETALVNEPSVFEPLYLSSLTLSEAVLYNILIQDGNTISCASIQILSLYYSKTCLNGHLYQARNLY